MAKRKIETTVEEIAAPAPQADEAVGGAPLETGAVATEEKFVRVRVLTERGLLAGRAVFQHEVHMITEQQYQEAIRVSPHGYELVET